MKRSWLLGGGALLVLVGMGFVCPAVAQLRDLGALPTASVLLLQLGLVLTGAGVSGLVLGLRRSVARG